MPSITALVKQVANDEYLDVLKTKYQDGIWFLLFSDGRCDNIKSTPNSVNLSSGKIMSIKSDRWIRQMATEHEMISHFEPKQVRHNKQGEKIVSV